MRKIQLQLIFLVVLLSEYANAGSTYFCPHTNVLLSQQTPSLENKGLVAAGAEGLNEPFPQYQTDVGKEPNNGKLYFDTQDCSTKDFFCLLFEQHQTTQNEKKFILFLPKKIQIGKEYKFKDMRLVTATSLGFSTDDSSLPVVQATLWQNIDGHKIPIKLTVEASRGVVYWDGLDFWGGKFNNGEICFLQSKKGFFSDVTIEEGIISKSH